MEGEDIEPERIRPKCLRLEVKRTSIFEDGVPIKNESFVKDVNRRSKEESSSVTNIGILGGGALILQTVIGPGIFTSPKGVAEFGGSIGVSYVVWTLSGLFSTLAALCFVELQLSVPRAGCEYGYIHKAFGKLPTFIYTWTRIALAEPATTAVFCIAFADYVADSIHDKCGPSELNRKLLAILAVVTLTLLNGTIKTLARVINIASNCGKVVALTVIISGGIYNISRNRERAIKDGFEFSHISYHSICLAFYNSLWAYGGWANVPHVTTGVKKPPQNLPRLILIVIPFVTILYLVTVTSFFTVLTRDELIGAEAIGVAWGEELYRPLGYVIPLFVCLIAFGNANGTFMQAGRTASVAVHDGYIPQLMSYIHVDTKIHVPAVVGRCLATTVLVYFIDVGVLVRFYVFTVWLFHGLTVLGLLLLRYRRRNAYERQFKVPILVPIAVLLFSIAIVAGPFTVWPPKNEFIFSICALLVSMALFVPFGKARVFARLLERFSVFLQLLMNVIPPKIHKHRRKNIGLRRRSVFSPTTLRSMSSLDIPETPGSFTSPSSEHNNTQLQWPKRPPSRKSVKLNLENLDISKFDRPLSRSSSMHSLQSANYCDVMNRFDRASEDWFDRRSYDSSMYDDAFSSGYVTPTSGYHTPTSIMWSNQNSPTHQKKFFIPEEDEEEEDKGTEDSTHF